jgi:hypothetical protein
MKPPEIFYTVDPPFPHLTPEERREWFNGAAKSDLELAFRDGVVVDYDKRTIPGQRADTDLEIRIVFRHKSALPKPD